MNTLPTVYFFNNIIGIVIIKNLFTRQTVKNILISKKIILVLKIKMLSCIHCQIIPTDFLYYNS